MPSVRHAIPTTFCEANALKRRKTSRSNGCVLRRFLCAQKRKERCLMKQRMDDLMSVFSINRLKKEKNRACIPKNIPFPPFLPLSPQRE